MLATYDSDVFTALNDFSTSRSKLDKVIPALQLIGDLIVKHGFQNRLGLALAHKHFDIGPKERLVEEISERGSRITPWVNVDESQITPYFWKLTSRRNAHLEWSPTEFVREEDLDDGQKQFVRDLENQVPFLEEIAKLFQQLKVEELLGLALVHRDIIQLKEGETLLETGDSDQRYLQHSPINKDHSERGKWTQTYWQFSKNENGKPGQSKYTSCVHCAGHCDAHG
jgi:hypothetical protein